MTATLRKAGRKTYYTSRTEPGAARARPAPGLAAIAQLGEISGTGGADLVRVERQHFVAGHVLSEIHVAGDSVFGLGS